MSKKYEWQDEATKSLIITGTISGKEVTETVIVPETGTIISQNTYSSIGADYKEPHMSVAEIVELVGNGPPSSAVDLVPQMLRAICKDEHVDAAEQFIAAWENIDWNWWPNG